MSELWNNDKVLFVRFLDYFNKILNDSRQSYINFEYCDLISYGFKHDQVKLSSKGNPYRNTIKLAFLQQKTGYFFIRISVLLLKQYFKDQ